MMKSVRKLCPVQFIFFRFLFGTLLAWHLGEGGQPTGFRLAGPLPLRP